MTLIRISSLNNIPQENRVEVHLPLADMTSAADASLMTKDNAYYVGSKDGGQYPFAINIPITGFVPADETYRIDLEGQYPAFANGLNLRYNESRLV